MELAETLANIGFDWKMALANLVNFLIIFYLLKRFVWGGIKKTLDARQTKIEKGLEDAQAAETSRLEAKQAYEARVEEAEQEAFAIVSDAHDQGRNIVGDSQEKARLSSDAIVEQGRNQVDQERQEMRTALRAETAALIVDGVERVLKEKIDISKDEEIIKNVVSA